MRILLTILLYRVKISVYGTARVHVPGILRHLAVRLIGKRGIFLACPFAYAWEGWTVFCASFLWAAVHVVRRERGMNPAAGSRGRDSDIGGVDAVAMVTRQIAIPLFLLVLSLVLPEMEALGSDWKYLGGSALPDGRQAVVFFDSQSVGRTGGTSITVWTVSFNLADVVSARKRHEKEVMERTGAKERTGYYPPYTVVNPETVHDHYVNIVSFEEVANTLKIKKRAELLVEIRCADSMFRTLSMVSYKYIGEIESRRKIGIPGSWSAINPKSNTDTLRKILCP